MGYIRYVGKVSFQDMVALYQMAAFMITATLHESSSLPILEAAAAGTPIIVPGFHDRGTGAGAAVEYVRSARRGWTGATHRCTLGRQKDGFRPGRSQSGAHWLLFLGKYGAEICTAV